MAPLRSENISRGRSSWLLRLAASRRGVVRRVFFNVLIVSLLFPIVPLLAQTTTIQNAINATVAVAVTTEGGGATANTLYVGILNANPDSTALVEPGDQFHIFVQLENGVVTPSPVQLAVAGANTPPASMFSVLPSSDPADVIVQYDGPAQQLPPGWELIVRFGIQPNDLNAPLVVGLVLVNGCHLP